MSVECSVEIGVSARSVLYGLGLEYISVGVQSPVAEIRERGSVCGQTFKTSSIFTAKLIGMAPYGAIISA